MAVFAIGDLHLSFARPKPLEVFGDSWIRHAEKIADNWKAVVGDKDTVLIPGDISWALRMDDADVDLKFIRGLPGNKILSRGNHDYWWGSASGLNSRYAGMHFLQNEHVGCNGIAVCASRGWIIPEDEKFTAEDMKIYKRELIRCRLSLDSALFKGYKEILFMMHYPPAYSWAPETGFTKLFEEYQVKNVVYGHLHGEKNFGAGITGYNKGINYTLVSSDYINFCPKKIID